MPKIDDVIKNAIHETAKTLGSQAKVALRAGLTPAALSRYVNGQVLNINYATWNLLYPVIKDHLPEDYHRNFNTWKNPQEWESFLKEHPQTKPLVEFPNDFDIGKNTWEAPLYGAEPERIALIEAVKQKLKYGYIDTLNSCLKLLMQDEEKRKELQKKSEEKKSGGNHT